MNSKLKLYYDAILNSYSQMFFSNDKWFAILLVLVSFLDPLAGLSGFLCVLSSVALASWFGFNPEAVRDGTYGFNSLMVGLVFGIHYQMSMQFFLILVLISLLTLFITIWLGNVLSKQRVPFFSLPFLLSIWILTLTLRSFHAVHLNERGIYTLNELYAIGGMGLVQLYEQINAFYLPLFFDVYLKSLGAIFFQSNILVGFIIGIGLLRFSRIAFLLSLVGFSTGYCFYYFLEGNISDLNYSFVGFNFILTSIALGGFFIIPSKKSFLLVFIITPIIAIIITVGNTLLSSFQLPLFSLPFSIVSVLMLFVLQFRQRHKNLELVYHQNFSPEENLYKHINEIERFKNDNYFHIGLPFYGEWFVSQGHAGNITHKGDWQYAWDFVVVDDNEKTYREPGMDVSHFYCNNLPILAPADGWVMECVDEVEDNAIGGVDLENNWGNSIIIKHSDYLFTKISHIKQGSFKVFPGSFVKKGMHIANCGNSGRSPEPHVHFQIQATPFIGSRTFKYPLSYYISQQNGKFEFHSFDYPKENQKISRVNTTKLIKDAFGFIPGTMFKFDVKGSGKFDGLCSWEVFTDAFNRSYIYCHNTKSFAYFVNNETVHYFTSFTGNKNSLLYYFYLGAYKILMGFYPDLEMKDKFPVSTFYQGPIKIIQDFVAPFAIYLKSDYNSRFVFMDDQTFPKHIIIESSAKIGLGNKIHKQINFEFTLQKDRINKFNISIKNKTINAVCILD